MSGHDAWAIVSAWGVLLWGSSHSLTHLEVHVGPVSQYRSTTLVFLYESPFTNTISEMHNHVQKSCGHTWTRCLALPLHTKLKSLFLLFCPFLLWLAWISGHAAVWVSTSCSKTRTAFTLLPIYTYALPFDLTHTPWGGLRATKADFTCGWSVVPVAYNTSTSKCSAVCGQCSGARRLNLLEDDQRPYRAARLSVKCLWALLQSLKYGTSIRLWNLPGLAGHERPSSNESLLRIEILVRATTF